MSDAIRIFTGPNDADKRVGINAGAEDDPGDGALYVNGDIIGDGGIYVDGGIFGALSANQSAVKIGGGAMPQTARTLELATNWLLNVGAGAVLPDTTDILATAVAQESGTVKAYSGTGASYTGTVPNVYFGYGTFIVLKRYATSINVLALSAHAYDGIALNFYNGSSWTGWDICRAFKSVTKSATVSFSAGTIGTRGFQTSWTSSQIGGTPVLAQITEVVASNEYHPFAFISGTTVYLNAYRATTSAVSSSANRLVSVTIYYI